MKIGVLGIGGVGSLIASNLLKENHEVYCFGSTESNKFLKKNGIAFKSNIYGNSNLFPYFNLSKDQFLDFLFVTVKGNNLIKALATYKKFFNKDTIAITLLNGLGHKEEIQKHFDINLIVGTIGSLEVSLNKNRVAIHKSQCKANIELASSDKKLQLHLVNLKKILEKAGIYCTIYEDENYVIWSKLIRLSVISIINTLSNSNLGNSFIKEETRILFLPLIEEFCLIGEKLGFNFKPKNIYEKIKTLPDNLTTSMQKDIYLGNDSEIEYIVGAPLKLGKSFGLKLPIMNKCYLEINDFINKNRNEK